MSHVKFLSRRIQDVQNKSLPILEEKFFDAIQQQDLLQIRSMLRRDNIDANCQNTKGCTGLGLAAEAGHVDIVNLFIQEKVDICRPDFYGVTPLQYAAEFNHIDVAKALIKAGANVNWMDEHDDGLSAIHMVACQGHTDMAQLLIQSGCDINVQDLNGVSVLHCAVANGHQEIVETLLKAGVELNPQGSRKNRTALHLAVDVGNEHMVGLLVKYGCKLNIQDCFGLTPLCATCVQDKTSIAKVMIKAGSKVNIGDDKDNLPLHFTARNGNCELTELLINSKSQLDSLNKHFEGPIHLAIRMGHLEIVKMLVKHGCDAGLCEEYGNVTPLHVAVNTYSDSTQFNQIVETLIEGGACLDSRAFTSLETPLYRAVDQDKIDLALCLLQHGADPNVDCPFDITILQKACQRDQLSIVEMLLYTNLDWKREYWLQTDIFSSGINPKLLQGYQEDIPPALLDNIELFFIIEEIRINPMSLIRCCRRCIRSQMRGKLFLKVKELDMPQKVKDFLMLKII